MLKYGFLLLSFFCGAFLFAQTVTPPFWDEIQAFKKEDSVQPPPKKPILLIGSSSFRMWSDVQAAFPGYPILNRSFGGSSFPDLLRYADAVIFPYRPKQVLIYCGDNDLAASDTVSAHTVHQRFLQLFTIIRSRLPKTAIAFVSIKPSPSRAHLMPKMQEANALIKTFLAGQRRTAYVDVYNPMLQPNGKPAPEIFLQDSLHMNGNGYRIWQQQIKPVLRN
jgi:lysophospholipase L1-like esterase